MKKIYKISIFLFLAVSFLSYCFFPVIFNSPKNLPDNIFLTDRNWVVITDKANEFWYKKIDFVDLESRFVSDLILIEDKNFYNHFWVDIFSKLRAFKDNIINFKIVSWWSTITEQYIKNRFFVQKNRNFLQKSREATLAFYYSFSFLPNTLWNTKNNLELKNRILSQYLHNVYFWNNIYWIVWAIEVYFWKSDLKHLSEEEIVLLISLINNPWVSDLKNQRFSRYFESVKTRLWYDFERTIFSLNKKENYDLFPFVSNLQIWVTWNKSTIDAELSFYAREIIKKTLEELKHKNVTNAAVFAIDPKTREILIYEWSRDFYSREIDWQVDVINSPRQLWSTLKPFLFLLAFEKWAWINTLLLDIVREYDSFQEWTNYITSNYSQRQYWLVTLKSALWNSFNNSSVWLASKIWLQEVYNFYKKYSFNLPNNSEFYWYSLVLWNPSITLKELVYSYTKLLDFEDKNKFLLYEILSNPDNRDISFWVNSILNTSVPMAVKTWTSSNFRDNVVISYHNDLVLWVWVWNNDNSSMQWVTGITWAWYIWRQIIEEAIRLWYIKEQNFSAPDWVSKKAYCLDLNCFRTRLEYDKTDINYSSKILDWVYEKSDLFSTLDNEEILFLENMWFYFK